MALKLTPRDRLGKGPLLLWIDSGLDDAAAQLSLSFGANYSFETLLENL
jgi:hypothetical protein